MGPMLPDVIAGIASIIFLFLLLKCWKPAGVWTFAHEPRITVTHIRKNKHGPAAVFRAWSPFILLTVMVIAWGLDPVKELLNAWGQLTFPFPGLHNRIILADGSRAGQIYKFNFLSASGTAIFFSILITIPLIRMSFRDAVAIFAATLNQLKYPIITISSILGFAYITNDSGISGTMAAALANTGKLFPVFAPVLGWLGVFITGSDTSSNALFGKLQYATAVSIHVDPVVTVGANCSGGVVGKMISPQSIAVAAAAGGLNGQESRLFRFTVKHSFILLSLVCVIVLLQAYVAKWLIPVYAAGNAVKNNSSKAGHSAAGSWYLLILLAVLLAIIIIVESGNRKKKADAMI